ncbi:MAG TPA: 6-carboxytetrahydropterin synthase [Gemmatimonadales bacterium]|jgi:6-pyruvoyltetrahydropterin/6-carboxytetrahydropterin synthase|nr:6-carboxytetrahydropterin synthase [Gemmatimonadales bacterium]
MPRCAVTRRSHFNAAHRLHNPDRPDEWNRDLYGVCNNPHFHGHNYELDVTVTGNINPETGEVMDLARLRDLVEREVVTVLDHRNLNLEVEWFRNLIPTAENIAVCIWRVLRAAVSAELELRIRLWETPRNYVEYAGE